jgi:hypothetical protein
VQKALSLLSMTERVSVLNHPLLQGHRFPSEYRFNAIRYRGKGDFLEAKEAVMQAILAYLRER